MQHNVLACMLAADSANIAPEMAEITIFGQSVAQIYSGFPISPRNCCKITWAVLSDNAPSGEHGFF